MSSVLQGNCHCGDIRFQLHGHADLGARVEGRGSLLCRKKGCLWLPLLKNATRLDVTREEGVLRGYEGGGWRHEFCSRCGTTIFGECEELGKCVNIRALRGVNVFDYDPRSNDSSAQVQHLPSPPLKGSCHCGKVAVELLQPLHELQIKEDNCSICSRNGWIGVYPSKSHVLITGIEHTRDYTFGRKFNGFPFCETCGVHVFQNLYGPPAGVVERLSEAGRERVKAMLDIRPVNVRVLEGVELGSLVVERGDEGTEGYEKMVLGLDDEEGEGTS